MRIKLELSEEEVRDLIASKVNNECSKHGYPGDIDRKITVVLRCAGDEFLKMPLEELGVTIHAEIEVS
jgi:hypothetical protein